MSDFPIGATTLNPDDKTGLIPKGIATRGQLDQFESRNIDQARIAFFRTPKKPHELVSIDFCLKLHKKMFDKTWDWAGAFRRYEVNIGNTPPTMVSVNLRNLCDDVLFWINHKTYSTEEICIRFHHRLVLIHPFPNGNGRHARILSDLLAKALALPLFTWGNTANLTHHTDIRMKYLSALRKADAGEIEPLMKFAKLK